MSSSSPPPEPPPSTRLAEAELRAAIRAARPLRAPVGRLPVSSKVILVGDPSRFKAAMRQLRQLGHEVVGLLSADPSRTDADFRPLGSPQDLGLAFVFAHAPSKSFFDGASPALAECHWLVEPGENHRSMGRDSSLMDRLGARLAALHARLADEESRECLARIIRARIEGNSAYLRPSVYRQYTHPRIQAGEGDIVLDCGAFDGDSSESFARAVGSTGHVIALEPDAANYRALCARIASGQLTNITPLRCATWMETTVLRVSGKLASAAVGKGAAGTAYAPVLATTIDQIKRDLGLPRIDVIKMDIEGAEVNSLLGARETIMSDKPRLMISAYHKPDDLVTIPELLLEMRPDYSLFLGHHNYYHTETDLYCH